MTNKDRLQTLLDGGIPVESYKIMLDEYQRLCGQELGVK